MIKKCILNSLAIIAIFATLSVTACNGDDDFDDSNKGTNTTFTYPQRYQVVPAWTTPDDNTIAISTAVSASIRSVLGETVMYLPIIYSDREGGFNNYLIYLGHINNVPITSGEAIVYNGVSPVTVGRSQSEVTSHTVEESVTTAVRQTTSSTNTKVNDTKISAGGNIWFIKANAQHQITNTKTNTFTSERSVSNTLTTAQTKATQFSNTVTVSIGNNNEPAGRYRLTMFATTDVYMSIRLSPDNTTLIDDPEFTVCAREDSFTYELDYDPSTTGSFLRTGDGGMLPIPEDFSSLALPAGFPRFVAVGINGRVAHSTDGINWEQKAEHGENWNSIAFGNGKFVASGNRSGHPVYQNAALSIDGINWDLFFAGSNVSIYDQINWSNVKYINGTWVAVGRYYWSSYSEGRIARSINEGVTWTVSSLGTGYVSGNTDTVWNDITYGNDRWIAVGTSGRMIRSFDGTTWGTETFVGTKDWNTITYGNNMFVMAGEDGRIAYSPNGLDWTEITVSTYTSTWNSVHYANDMFIAVGNTANGFGRMARSTNGIDWTIMTAGSSNWMDITYGEEKWVAVGGTPDNIGRIAYSTNGTSWTENTMGNIGSDYWRSITIGIGY